MFESTARGIDGDQSSSVCGRHRLSVKGKLDVIGADQVTHTRCHPWKLTVIHTAAHLEAGRHTHGSSS